MISIHTRSPLFPSRRPTRGASAGFTMFELMMVLGIIAVLAGASIYWLTGNLDVAKVQRVETDIQTITTQLRTYEMLNYTMPSTEQGIKALVSKPGGEPQPRRWRQLMQAEPLDPWGKPYAYRNPGKKNPQGFDIYSLGPDRQESDDDIGNWQSH